ncbi:AraC family transcriptional regulator [Piscibacillus halophilus]|uniref:AraC family transcriptional regulator n=1 Tax=Piscibacillus halophilus TaxID=571933 RepID=UPI00158C9641|nr:AraC family transcriptional regulator [Piscibacillus halophilus]
MSSLQNMNAAIEYIEDHLKENIDYQKVSQLAQCSEFHFKRMFSTLAGVPLSLYIRRRRMTLAAIELKHTNKRIIDLAMDYGYISPNSFARAFHDIHGVKPSAAKQDYQLLKSYPKMTFQIIVKGVEEMNVKLIDKEAFKIIGIKKKMRVYENDVDPEVNRLWKNVDKETLNELKQYNNIDPNGISHIVINYEEMPDTDKNGSIDYYFGVATTKEIESPYGLLEVPKTQWAVFEVEGDWLNVQETWERIYQEWFPSSEFEHQGGPEILSNQENIHEIWVPIVKKSK